MCVLVCACVCHMCTPVSTWPQAVLSPPHPLGREEENLPSSHSHHLKQLRQAGLRGRVEQGWVPVGRCCGEGRPQLQQGRWVPHGLMGGPWGLLPWTLRRLRADVGRETVLPGVGAFPPACKGCRFPGLSPTGRREKMGSFQPRSPRPSGSGLLQLYQGSFGQTSFSCLSSYETYLRALSHARGEGGGGGRTD